MKGFIKTKLYHENEGSTCRSIKLFYTEIQMGIRNCTWVKYERKGLISVVTCGILLTRWKLKHKWRTMNESIWVHGTEGSHCNDRSRLLHYDGSVILCKRWGIVIDVQHFYPQRGSTCLCWNA